jgi:hypothetical protein
MKKELNKLGQSCAKLRLSFVSKPEAVLNRIRVAGWLVNK